MAASQSWRSDVSFHQSGRRRECCKYDHKQVITELDHWRDETRSSCSPRDDAGIAEAMAAIAERLARPAVPAVGG